jgi:membrane protease YdiL (CAAX protease family)
MPHRDTTFKTILFFLVIALLGVTTWIILAFPRLTILKLSLDRSDALRSAADYLQRERGVEVKGFKHAVIFANEGDTNRYLQKSLGRVEANKWLADHDYEPFSWVVRFFKPGQKEEYRINLSSRDGRVLSYRRTIDENVPRPDTPPEEARRVAERALKQLGLDLARYELKDSTVQRRSHRVEYTLTWKRRDVNLPWTRDPKADGAKVLAGVLVSGREVLSFDRQVLWIPDGFDRYLDTEQEAGRNLSTIFYLVFLVIVISAVVVVINARNHLALVAVKPFYCAVSLVLYVVVSIASLTLFEGIISSYPTSQALGSFVWRSVMQVLLSAFFIVVGFIVASLAAEAVRQRWDETRPKGSLLFYVRSTFFSRDILGRVLMGYAAGCGMLGLQAVLFAAGERHFGVWSEDPMLTQFSNSYLPAIVALAMGLKASLSEEFTYRVFVMNALRPRVKFLPVAIFLSALVWGFGHTAYAVFPTWFRGMEVTVLGVFLSVVYLRCGIIAVLVAHYLFDVFWASSGCLLGDVKPLYFYSSLGVLLLPLIWGVIAFFRNEPETERSMDIALSPHQSFNRKVLETFVAHRRNEGADLASLQKECFRHGWDPVVVREVFSRLADQQHS